MNPLKGIVEFNQERNLTTFNGETEYAMLSEELQEFLYACSIKDETEMVDALCDVIVVATGSLYKLGYDPVEALKETVREITSRQGAINPATGKWEKDVNQNPSTLYKADYSLTRR